MLGRSGAQRAASVQGLDCDMSSSSSSSRRSGRRGPSGSDGSAAGGVSGSTLCVCVGFVLLVVYMVSIHYKFAGSAGGGQGSASVLHCVPEPRGVSLTSITNRLAEVSKKNQNLLCE